MTTTTTSGSRIASPRALRGRHRAALLGLWAAQLLLIVQFATGGVLKLVGQPAMTAMFDTIGAGQWLRFVVGTLEVAAAVGLLVPQFSGLAAAGLVALLVGATATNIAILHITPALPMASLVLAAWSRTGAAIAPVD